MELHKYKTTIIDQMEKVGLSKETALKEMSFALQLVNKNKKLAECSRDSVLYAIVNIANVGLSLNPAKKECYIIPRWTKNGSIAELQPSYIGLANLLTKHTAVRQLITNVVREGDTFSIDSACFDNPVTHTIDPTKKGAISGSYSIARFKDGNFQAEYMSISELNEIRERSEGYKAFMNKKAKSCVWVDWHAEMCRKSVIKRLCKYIPNSHSDQLAKAIEIDNSDYQASYNTISYIEGLIMDAHVSPELYREISNAVETGVSERKANEYISLLKKSMPTNLERLESTGSLNVGEMDKAISEKMAIEDFKER